jgi:large subunit ribosomal protein L9
MKVVLLQNVKGVGQKGDVKEVKEGYALNHLIPRNLAKIGTKELLKEVQKISKDKVTHTNVILQKIEETFRKVSEQEFVFTVKANESGSLFAKFDEKNLLEELHKKGYKALEQKHLTISGSPVKHIGTYEVSLKEKDIKGKFTITIK